MVRIVRSLLPATVSAALLAAAGVWCPRDASMARKDGPRHPTDCLGNEPSQLFRRGVGWRA